MATFTTLSGSQIEDILRGFGLSGYRGHTPIAAGTINTNVRVNLDQGPLFLRINEGKALQDVQREAAIVAHVAARGVPTPVPLTARDGQRFFSFDGAFVSLFPWAPGHTLSRSQVGPTQARQAGAALAALHRAGQDFPDHRPGRYEPDEIDRRLAAITAQARPELAPAVAALGPELRALASERIADVPQGLIHGDLFIDNVLYRDDGHLTALLDFEQASWGRMAYDLAVTLLAFAFGQDDFRPAETRALIEGYLDGRSVDAIEAQAFGAELRFAACRFAVTRITDVYLRRNEGAPTGKDYRRYLLRLQKVHEHLAAADGLLSLSG